MVSRCKDKNENNRDFGSQRKPTDDDRNECMKLYLKVGCIWWAGGCMNVLGLFLI